MKIIIFNNKNHDNSDIHKQPSTATTTTNSFSTLTSSHPHPPSFSHTTPHKASKAMRGFLTKRGEKNKFSWKRRFFEVQSQTMVYYEASQVKMKKKRVDEWNEGFFLLRTRSSDSWSLNFSSLLLLSLPSGRESGKGDWPAVIERRHCSGWSI